MKNRKRGNSQDIFFPNIMKVFLARILPLEYQVATVDQMRKIGK